jgi:chromosomal replication initiation ATPase DnaA
MQTKISDKRVQEALEYCQGVLAPYDLVFSIKAIRASSRAAYINGIRALVITILRYQRGFKYTEIGYILNRDHTTVLHLFKNYDTFSSGRVANFKEIRDSLITIS